MPLLPLAIALFVLPAVDQTPAPGPASFAVRAVRVFDGRQVTTGRTVVIQDGLIARIGGPGLAIPAGIPVIDGRGRTLLPGLIDAHVHLSNDIEADLTQAAALGVTTVLDMWSGSARLARIKVLEASDPPGMADVRTAGNGATAPGGHPSQMGPPDFPTLADSADARAFVVARMAEGADYLKIIYDDLAGLGRPLPMLSRGTLVALIAAAHEQGKLAVVHIGSAEQARAAIESGADGLVHLFAAATASPGLTDLMGRRHAFAIATLGVLQIFHCGKPNGAALAADSLLRPWIRPQWRPMMAMKLGSPDRIQSCAGTEQTIRELSRAGALVVGTDSPVPGETYGASVHGELALLVDAGITPAAALAAATSVTASRFRLADRGAIRAGLRADLVLVDGDPTKDIRATRRIVTVWKRGVAVERVRYPE